MREILIKLHNASLYSFDGEYTPSMNSLFYKQPGNEGYNHFSAIKFYAEYMDFNADYIINDFNSEINEIEFKDGVHFILDIESSTCSILYKVDRDYINSLNIMFNQDEIYSISSDVSQASLNKLIAAESDFFLVEIDNELYIFDSTSLTKEDY